MRVPSPLAARLWQACCCAAVCVALAPAAERHPALTPQEALTTFQLEEGLSIELVAAEPLVVDPVAFAFEPDGRMYVVEGRAYPDPVERGSGESTLGRIGLLEDTDGDGRYDRRKEFATGLGYVNGIQVWRGGLFVTTAPNILYLKDHDGDGIADEQRVVLAGFEATKTAQLRVSHPTLGFDGKVYVTSGLNGGSVISPLHPDRTPVTFNGRDGRYDPDTFVFENTGGRAQFGLALDAFGRRFITTNRHPLLQVMLEPWQLARNPHLAFSETMQEVSLVEADAKVLPISGATVAADFVPSLMSAPHVGTFTSACGTHIFGGTALAPEHVGDAFICEPAQNLVQRQTLRQAGASFRSERVGERREFLASTDVWFRPVFVASGPDGALYIADMNRREIDHPRYIPAESRGLLDFAAGKDRGRIYRVVRTGATRPQRPADALAALASSDEWWRTWAHRILIERADPKTAPAVADIARRASHPAARARALWVLRSIGGLNTTLLAAALRDPHPGVREQAVQLAGELAPTTPALRPVLLALANDPDARVRFRTALALGSIESEAATDALASIAARDGDDRWTRAAVLSGIGGRLAPFLDAVLRRRSENPRAFAATIEDLGRVFGAGADGDDCRSFVRNMISADGELGWRTAAVLGVVEGFRGRAGAATTGEAFRVLLGDDGDLLTRAQAFIRRTTERAVDATLPVPERLGAIALLGCADFATAGSVLGALLDAREPIDVQLAAVRTLERLGDGRGGELLVAKENWRRYTPRVREAVLATLTSTPALIDVLFTAIRAGVVAASDVPSTRRNQLLKHTSPNVRRAAAEAFKHLESGVRMAVYQKFRDTLDPKADAALGREVFLRACSACHTHRGVGGKVGPDLTGVRHQPAEALLLHILVPNYEVTPSYQAITVTTRDERTITGWLAAETAASLTLRTAFGSEETVLRANIATLSASGVSLMPDGLEHTMTAGEMSALLAFLKSDG